MKQADHPQYQEYKAKKAADDDVQRCLVCGQLGTKAGMDPHHPNDRSFGNILTYAR